MHSTPSIEPARPDERLAAFRLAFQHLPEEQRELRVATALDLVRKQGLDPAGILVARNERALVGVMLCLPLPGASGLVWPPQVVAGPGSITIEDQLVQHGMAWLRQNRAKLAQALLVSSEAPLAAPLERNGFVHVTTLWYFRHHLDRPLPWRSGSDDLTYQAYEDDRDLFHDTLLASYEATQDCPELSGVRDIDEIMEGHRTQGSHDPERWWLVRKEGRPVGVLLLAELRDSPCWDVAYVGVVAGARRQGLGRRVMQKALAEARRAGAQQLTLSVDERNRPAWDLYHGLGFEPYDQREVFLAIWK